MPDEKVVSATTTATANVPPASDATPVAKTEPVYADPGVVNDQPVDWAKEAEDAAQPGTEVSEGEIDTESAGNAAESEGEPAAEAAPAVETEQPDPELDTLVARAAALNLSDDDVSAFGTVENAKKAIDALERHAINISRQFGQQPAPQNGQAPQNQGTQPKPQAAQQPPAPEVFRKFDLKLDPEKYDDEIVAQLTGMNDHYARQIESMQAALAGVYQGEQQRAAAQAQKWFDGVLDSMGDGYTEIFGKSDALQPGSPQLANRTRVFQEADALAIAYSRIAANGGTPPPAEEIVKRAVTLAFGDKQATVARNSLKAKLKARQGQIQAKPTHRLSNRSDLTPEQRATIAVRDKMRSFGMLEAPVEDAKF